MDFRIKNLQLATRLPFLRSMNLVGEDNSLAWIYSQPSLSRVTVTGSQDGVNKQFSVPAGGDFLWFVGGIIQDPSGDYSWVDSTTVEFVVAPVVGSGGKVMAFQTNAPVGSGGTTGLYYGDLSGTVDGTNNTFVIPSSGFNHVMISMDGFVLTEGTDFSRMGRTVVFEPEWIPFEGRKTKVRTW